MFGGSQDLGKMGDISGFHTLAPIHPEIGFPEW
jgi:hypothetical protein